MKPRNSAVIVEKKGKYMVRMDLADGKIIYAERDAQGRIQYSRAENVPRDMKKIVIPKLFKEIDNRVFGMNRL